MTLALEGIARTVDGEAHLSGVNLTLTPGTMNVLLGHTGAGKTSLLRIIAGLDRPTQGTVRHGGVDITRRPARMRSVALVYQQFINYPSLTVRDNIASPLRLRRAPDTDARVRELARLLRIEELLDRLPGALSGGQQQRVAIARALAKSAEIVLLDEPLVNLDYKLREDLRDELRALFGAARSGGAPATVVYATTDPAEALALGGTTILVHRGRVLQHAPTLEVYHRPASVTAARVFSDPPMNLIDGVVIEGPPGEATNRRPDDGPNEATNEMPNEMTNEMPNEMTNEMTVGAPGKRIELGGELRIPIAVTGAGAHLVGLAAGPYCFGIRASDCRLHQAAASDVAVRARVELSEISGSETFVYLRSAGSQAQLIVQQDGVFHHQLDDELTVYLDPDRLLAFAPGPASGSALGSPAGPGDDQRLMASYHVAASP